MRITLVSPFDPSPRLGSDGAERVGGVERVFGQVSRNLARRGHDVTLVCSTKGAAASTSEDGVNIVRSPRRATFLEAPVARLSRSVPNDSDVVHVAATYPFTTPWVLRRARELEVPSVLDFHFEPSPATLLGRMAANVYRHIGPRDYRFASLALVRSLAYGHSAPSLSHVPVDRWRVVPNGIDPERFNPKGPARAGDYLLYVGRLVVYKGVPVLFQALALLRLGLPLYIAGEGPMGHTLRLQARTLGLDVRFLGRVPEEDLPALYRGARLTILPSVNRQECFGISLLESMACGTPVVASRLPGVAEVASVGGLLAEPGDPKSLARQLRVALQDGILPRGPKLAAAVHNDYSWAAVTDRLESAYRELVRDPTAVGGPPQAMLAA
ncbi:MAG: hypothetical protein QOJ26_892 [Thermoplasmata archaeon]|nr:hypothetical protein [Thermoplasmata archaeon]MEA3166023.1 hypothetical protein [Thermoplasmata archaeon]